MWGELRVKKTPQEESKLVIKERVERTNQKYGKVDSFNVFYLKGGIWPFWKTFFFCFSMVQLKKSNEQHRFFLYSLEGVGECSAQREKRKRRVDMIVRCTHSKMAVPHLFFFIHRGGIFSSAGPMRCRIQGSRENGIEKYPCFQKGDHSVRDLTTHGKKRKESMNITSARRTWVAIAEELREGCSSTMSGSIQSVTNYYT